MLFGAAASPLVVLAIPAAVLTGLAFAAPIAAFSATQKTPDRFAAIFRFGITPLFLFPSETFSRFPIAPTLEGQYIIKNVVLIGAAMVIGATVRGGRIVPEPRLPEAPR